MIGRDYATVRTHTLTHALAYTNNLNLVFVVAVFSSPLWTDASAGHRSFDYPHGFKNKLYITLIISNQLIVTPPIRSSTHTEKIFFWMFAKGC